MIFLNWGRLISSKEIFSLDWKPTQGIDLAREGGFKNKIATIEGAIANIYFVTNDYQNALKYNLSSLTEAELRMPIA